MHAKIPEKIFVTIALLFYTRALADFIPENHPLSSFKEVAAYCTLIITLLLMIRHWKKVAYVVLKEKLLWIFMLLIVFSIQWSDLPSETLNQVIPLLRVTVFGVYFAARFSIKEQIQILSWTFAVAALLSLFFAVALPYYGIVGMGFISNMEDIAHTGTWRGIYVHKTLLGTIMALGMLSFLCRTIGDREHRWLSAIGFCACLGMLLMSTTKGALAVLFIIFALVPFYRAIRLKFDLAIPFFALVLLMSGIISVLLMVYAEQALSVLGRDVTLTGRTIYWPLMLNKIWERPWFGYGYHAFWIGGWKGESADIWRYLAVGNEPPHAHNGFLNLWFDVGLIGLGVFMAGFATNFMRAMTWVRTYRATEGLVPICYLTFLLLTNLTESFLVEPEFFWLFYVSVTLSMHQVAMYQGNSSEIKSEIATETFDPDF